MIIGSVTFRLLTVPLFQTNIYDYHVIKIMISIYGLKNLLNFYFLKPVLIKCLNNTSAYFW